ncbi:hypothetical protein [Candidatus Chlamydia corallus]|uniref:hypothetical protein n=1 Tax=Candidatus Chlamydia corallus TaxID=2038470 RepID=UPI000C2FD73E|nr:hypothetical protein [Candidatus Chlamydia corallus]
MSVNPSGNKDSLWIPGAHDQHPDVQNSGVSSTNLGTHSVTSSGGGSNFLQRMRRIVSRFFGGESARVQSEKKSLEAPVTPKPLSLSDVGGDARATEGAAKGLIKHGYQEGKKVDTPSVRTFSTTGARPSRPAPPPPSTTGARPSRPAPPPPSTTGARPKRPAPPPPSTTGARPSRPAPPPPSTTGTRAKPPLPPKPSLPPRPASQSPKGILKQPGQQKSSGKRVSWSDED